MAVDASGLRQGFVEEGRFLAFPLSIPDETYPIPPDDCHITALTESPDGRRVYGTTGGRQCHVIAASHKGAAGGVLDVGVVPGAARLPCVVLYETERGWGHDLLVGAAGRPDGSAFYRCTVSFPGDTVQEPSFPCSAIERAVELPGVALRDAVRGPDDRLWCLTDRGLLAVARTGGEPTWLVEHTGGGPAAPSQLVRAGDDALCWIDPDGRLRGIDTGSLAPIDAGVCLPWSGEGAAVCACGRTVVHADAQGALRAVDLAGGEVRDLGTTPIPHVQCLAALPDGRVYGVCGRGIGHFFQAEASGGPVRDLGAIVSVIVAKRYGFEFSCAVTGRDGEIYLGEDDRGGHLWVYCPPLEVSPPPMA